MRQFELLNNRINTQKSRITLLRTDINKRLIRIERTLKLQIDVGSLLQQSKRERELRREVLELDKQLRDSERTISILHQEIEENKIKNKA